MPTLTNRWAVLALLFLVRFSVPMQFQSVAAVAPFLNAELGLSYTRIGLLLGLFMLPGAFLALPGGILGSRFGSKAVMVGGLALMLLGGLLLPLSPSFPLMFAARLLAGVGAVVLNVQLGKVVTDWFTGKELATALSISAASFGLGVGVAVGALGSLAELTSWQIAIHGTTALTTLSLALLLVLYQDRPEDGALAVAAGSRLWNLSARELALVVVAGTAQVGFVTGYVVFMSFAPTLLVERGASVARAGSLVSLAALVAIVSVPLGGYLTDRTGKINLLIAGGALATALTCVMITLSGPPVLWILLFGLTRGGCTGGIMSLPGHVLRPESRSTGFGIYYTVHYLGLAGLSAAAGSLLDVAGSAVAPVLFAGLLWLTIVASLLAFRLLQRRWAPAVVPETGP